MNNLHRLLHESLRACDFPLQSLRVQHRFTFKISELNVDPGQSLCNFIMEFAADFSSFIFLGGKDFSSQVTEMLLAFLESSFYLSAFIRLGSKLKEKLIEANHSRGQSDLETMIFPGKSGN